MLIMEKSTISFLLADHKIKVIFNGEIHGIYFYTKPLFPFLFYPYICIFFEKSRPIREKLSVEQVLLDNTELSE